MSQPRTAASTNGGAPVEPRPASTVMVLRPSAAETGVQQAFEVLFIRRPMHLRFMPGFWVFPGGAVDAEDGGHNALTRIQTGAPPAPLAAPNAHGKPRPPIKPPDNLSMAHLVAAVREVFEETGILLTHPVPLALPGDEAAALRQAVRADPGAFFEFLNQKDLWIRGDDLRYLQRRITPKWVPIRFDTQFFVARLPEGQEVHPFRGEVAGVQWLSPLAALDRWQQQGMDLSPPTIRSLRRLRDFRSLDDVLHHLPSTRGLIDPA